MQTSLQKPETIDLVTFDARQDEYALIISANEEWEDSREEQERLLRKIGNYLNFAVNGQMAKHYPESAGKKVRIQVDTASELPERISRTLAQMQPTIEQYDVLLCINRLEPDRDRGEVSS